MTRRDFTKAAASFVAGCALALRLHLPTFPDEFDPLAYKGDWKWINVSIRRSIGKSEIAEDLWLRQYFWDKP